MQTIKVIREFPDKESLSTLVNFEFLKGICVLFLLVNAEIHYPKLLKDPLMHVNSTILNSLSS